MKMFKPLLIALLFVVGGPALNGQDNPCSLMLRSASNGVYRLTINGSPQRVYIIQYTDSPASPYWQFLGTATADFLGFCEFDNTPLPSAKSRFYRAMSYTGSTASPFRMAVWTNFIAHTNGRTTEMWSERSYPPAWPNAPPVLAWNTNCLLYGLEAFTAISQCNEFEVSRGQLPVTLLTRRHGYMRGHGQGENGLRTNHYAGQKVWFCTASNTVVQMTIAADFIRVGGELGGYYDYGLVMFTADVPDGIKPMSVISAEDFQSYYARTPDIPFMFLGTEQLGHCGAGDEVPAFYYELNKGGDSGSPDMIPSPDNKLILISGRGAGAASPQMQADIDTLSLHVGLNTTNYQLGWYDLSPWAP